MTGTYQHIGWRFTQVGDEDLWSLGIVTYEMLAGRLPFQRTNTLAMIQAVLTATRANPNGAARRGSGV